MPELSSSQEHSRIASLIPESEQIAAPHANNLGSFVIGKVSQGEFVPLGDRHAIEADFDNIDALSEVSLRANLETYKEELVQDPKRTALRESLSTLPEQLQNTFTTALFAVSTAKQFFGDKLADKEKRDALGWRTVDATRDDSYKIKKLSETADDGVCVEYSLFVGEVMNRLGEDTQYTVGYRQDWADEPSFYHAFLTSDKTQLIIDAYALAQTANSSKPLGLMLAGEGSSIKQRPEEAVSYQDIFGRQATYSAVSIPAGPIEQVA